MRGTQAKSRHDTPDSAAACSGAGARSTFAGRLAAIAAGVVAATLVIEAVTPQSHSQAGAVQLQLGDEFYAEGRYRDALDAYQKALTSVGSDDVRSARAGVVQSALRIAEFDLARREAEALLYGLMRLQDKIRKEGTVLRKERVIMSGQTEPILIGERA